MTAYLFANPYGIGDALFTLRVAEALRAAQPGSRIGFLCNERTADLVKLSASVDRVHVLNRDGFRNCGWTRLPGRVLELLRGVAREEYQVMFDLSLGRELPFYAALLGIPKRIGFDHKGRGLFLTRKVALERYEGAPVSSTQARLLCEAGITRLALKSMIDLRVGADADRRAEDLLHSPVNMQGTGQRPLAVAPGGGRSWGKNAIYKQWDPERFSATAASYARRHGCGIVLLGDEPETGLLERVANAVDVPILVLAGQPIDVIVSVLRRSRALLCNDGGLMHLSAALGVPVVAIFGPVDAYTYGPHEAVGSVLTADVPCRPCYSGFRFPACEHQRRCLTDLSVDKVMAVLEEIV